MSQQSLSRKVFRLHVAFVRKINDTHIFVRQAIPLLEKARDTYEESTHRKDRRYYVPAVKRTKFARRKDKELKEIFDRFINQELYENLIVTAVSHFESFLFDALKLIILAYPQKLTLSVRGLETNRSIPLHVLLQANSLEDALGEIIDERLNAISYAKPSAYLEYLGNVAGVDAADTTFLEYIEIKATRDVIVHNSGTVNEIYLSKAGERKRGEIGDKLVVDSDYFDHCVAVLKRLSGIIRRDVERNFSDREV